MSKLYVGNLPGTVTEEGLRRLFSDYSVTPTRVVLKRGGYAFVDCGDQSAADRAIDKLNGLNFLGCPIIIEPSLSGATTPKRRCPNQVETSNTNPNGTALRHFPTSQTA